MSSHTEFARIAISYDRLPEPGTSVWKQFPPAWQWNVLSPRGQVMNLKGHEAAVAYRERASEPFHYTVLSYDERGRVEAILRCTENIGFDAVYYHYNSMNLVTSVTTSDALRSHTTWYGYDHQGRVDSVWTELDTLGSGLLPLPRLLPPPGSSSRAMSNLHAPQQIAVRAPAGTPDITYEYTKVGQVATMSYPPAGVVVDYTYNGRKWLTNLLARQPMVIPSMVFSEQLRYDSSGQIIEQRSQHGFSAAQVQRYGYDSTDRLIWWTQHNGADTVGYSYDDAGNRTELRRSWDMYPESYGIIAGRNQLESRGHHDYEIGDTNVVYQYNRNGSLTRRRMQHDSSTGAWTNWPGWPKPSGNAEVFNEELRYSYRNLLNRVYHTDSLRDGYDWRYRYSASGEREQKRLVGYFPWIPPIVTHPVDTPKIVGGWVYYLLGGNSQQLAVYHGQQDTGNVCGDTVSGVSMYPVEYLTYGNQSAALISTAPTGAKTYTIADHLGSVRASTGGDGTFGYDYEPFGAKLAGGPVRKGFIDRERDAETGTLNTGVRQMEDSRFTSIDPMWEKYPGLSPYVYGNNNPLRLIDQSGKEFTFYKADAETREILLDANGQPMVDEKLKAQVEYAIRELERAGVAEVNMLKYLRDSKDFVLNIVRTLLPGPTMGFHEDQVAGAAGLQYTLFWCPDRAMMYRPWLGACDEDIQSMSPALTLVHEGNHPYRRFTNEKQFRKDMKKETGFDPQYGRIEERKAINSEFSAGQQLGQLKYMRSTHTMKGYVTQSPPVCNPMQNTYCDDDE